MLGDFNINLLNSDCISSHANFLDHLGSCQVLPYITLPTRITSQSNTLIDNIFLSANNFSSLSGNLIVGISDHLPQFLFLDIKGKSISIKNNNLKRDWAKFDEEKFHNDFNNTNWDQILQCEKNDSEASFNAFFDKFTSLYDKHVPLVKLTKKQAKLRSKPWITKGLLTSMKIRDSVLCDMNDTGDPKLKQFLFSRYKFYRNRIVTLLRLSKKLHYRNYFVANSNNVRKVWTGIREIISVKNSKASNDISLLVNNTVTSDPVTVSESFNEFFSSVATKVRSKIPASRHNFSTWLQNPHQHSIFLSPSDPDEIQTILNSFSKNKASGPNSIPLNILNIVSQEISIILSNLVNLSFLTGIFPSKLKEAMVIPVFKNGSPLSTENYRPISLLSNIDKVYQKLMHKRLVKFLENTNCLYPLQFGFRPKHSTSSALINCTEKIRKALDSGKYVCSVLIDLRKAFDTVDHDILFSKLNFYGVRGVALSWFKSFLSNRSQYVSVSGTKSSIKFILHGVPQGSVLGPLLFLLYVNDLHHAIPFSMVNLFADDTLLLGQQASVKSLAKRINIDLKCLVNWLNANKISLNSKKSELLLFSPTRVTNSFDFKVKINGTRLYPSDSAKYLGLIIDSKLNWDNHISNVCKKLVRANGAISILRHFVSRDILLSIYYALFHSHLSYSANVWALNNNSTKRILNLQKKAVRLMTFSEFNAHSLPLFTQLRILSFPDFIQFCNIIFMYNLLNGNLPSPLYDTFDLFDITRVESRPRRTKSGLLRFPKVSTIRFGNFSLTYQAVASWDLLQNYLDVDNMSNLSLSRLKYLIKFYFLSSYI